MWVSNASRQISPWSETNNVEPSRATAPNGRDPYGIATACRDEPSGRTSSTVLDTAMHRGRARGLVMVDHTIDRAVWRCRLDDDARAFLAADEHANRGEIHPCRTPWETVCVEPNGDLRVTDFFGPIVGNVTTPPMNELWNAPAAIEARERAKLSRLCGPTGPVTCITERAT